MIWLAKNITYEEMIFSQTAARHGIDNTPNDAVNDNLARTALALQVIRSYFRRPVVVSSGFRCDELNVKIGGSKNSHHRLGLAVDFTIPDVPIEDVIKKIPHLIHFDQLINEYGRWIHLSVHPRLGKQVFDVK